MAKGMRKFNETPSGSDVHSDSDDEQKPGTVSGDADGEDKSSSDTRTPCPPRYSGVKRKKQSGTTSESHLVLMRGQEETRRLREENEAARLALAKTRLEQEVHRQKVQDELRKEKLEEDKRRHAAREEMQKQKLDQEALSAQRFHDLEAKRLQQMEQQLMLMREMMKFVVEKNQ